MNWKAAQLRAHRAAHLAALFGTASLSAIASSSAYAGAAPAQAAAAAPVEEVLITGSLISGAPAIGPKCSRSATAARSVWRCTRAPAKSG